MRNFRFAMATWLVSLLLASVCTSALAQDDLVDGVSGGINTGTVRTLFVSHNQGGFVIIESRGPQTGAPPVCSQANRYAFSLTASGGYAYLATLQLAISRQLPVTMAGNGSCTVSGSREDLTSLQLVTPSP
jgi:hypothetical protein